MTLEKSDNNKNRLKGPVQSLLVRPCPILYKQMQKHTSQLKLTRYNCYAEYTLIII